MSTDSQAYAIDQGEKLGRLIVDQYPHNSDLNEQRQIKELIKALNTIERYRELIHSKLGIDITSKLVTWHSKLPVLQ